MPFQQWDSQQTTVCVTLEGAQVLDIWGTPFPTAKNCTTVDHRRARPQPPVTKSPQGWRDPHGQITQKHPLKWYSELVLPAQDSS